MYELTDLQFNAAEVARLVEIAHFLDLSRGAASYITDAEETLKEYTFHASWFVNAMTKAIGRHLTAIRVVVLQPGQQIPLHADAPITGRRYHVPIAMNVDCWVYHGDWQQLYPGRVYRMDPTQSHGAVNWGLSRRLHLIVDTE